MMDWLGYAAAAVTVIGGVAAAIGFIWKKVQRLQLRAKIERLLATKTAPNDDSLTESQLAAHFGTSESVIAAAANGSKKIEPWGGHLGDERRWRCIRNSN
jgi:hypothetical protein